MITVYDSVAILYKDESKTYDTYGNETINRTGHMVYVQPRGIYQAEFYNASQLGLHPSLNLHMANRADYDGEKLVSFDGKMYNIIRVDWTAQRDSIDLVCEERVGDA